MKKKDKVFYAFAYAFSFFKKNIVFIHSPMHSHVQNKKNRILCSHSYIFKKIKK